MRSVRRRVLCCPLDGIDTFHACMQRTLSTAGQQKVTALEVARKLYIQEIIIISPSTRSTAAERRHAKFEIQSYTAGLVIEKNVHLNCARKFPIM